MGFGRAKQSPPRPWRQLHHRVSSATEPHAKTTTLATTNTLLRWGIIDVNRIVLGGSPTGCQAQARFPGAARASLIQGHSGAERFQCD
jgi:hypothetical protein